MTLCFSCVKQLFFVYRSGGSGGISRISDDTADLIALGNSRNSQRHYSPPMKGPKDQAKHTSGTSCCNSLWHRRIHSPQTYVRRPWLIVLVNLGYSFNVHACLPLCVAISQHCEETRMLLPNAGRKIADWLSRSFIQCGNVHVMIAWSITASVH